MLDLTLCLDPSAPAPLYQQLYNSLTGQIRAGRLRAGDKLPGKRSLANQLAIAVNTVDTAYQMLTAEGYLEVRPKSGFYVLPYGELSAGPPAGPAAPTPPPEPSGGVPPLRFRLSTGAVDTALFPFRTWGRIQKELLYASPELLTHGHPQGDENLREAIADYLRAYRGVDCTPGQLVVGAGVEYLLGLAAQLLRGLSPPAGCAAAVENPGYSRSATILANNGVSCRYVDIDGSGLPVEGLEESGAGLCYVTPSHHFPTGVTMPAWRRAQLLRWAAREPGRYIFEDDYDAEFRFDTRPLPSLQGMAGANGPVIYLCTFSKSLAPSIRIACMVLPLGLLERWRAAFGSYANTVSRFEQQTLCRFLTEGYFTRHLARMRNAYRLRMEALVQTLEGRFGRERIALKGRHTGLHLLLTLRDGPGEADMVSAAAAAGVGLRGLSEYYLSGAGRCPPNTVILGYASLQNRDISALAEALAGAWV